MWSSQVVLQPVGLEGQRIDSPVGRSRAAVLLASIGDPDREAVWVVHQKALEATRTVVRDRVEVPTAAARPRRSSCSTARCPTRTRSRSSGDHPRRGRHLRPATATTRIGSGRRRWGCGRCSGCRRRLRDARRPSRRCPSRSRCRRRSAPSTPISAGQAASRRGSGVAHGEVIEEHGLPTGRLERRPGSGVSRTAECCPLAGPDDPCAINRLSGADIAASPTAPRR